MSLINRKKNKIHNKVLSKYHEVTLIESLTKILYEYKGIAMHTNFFKYLNSDFYYVSISTFSDNFISIYKINFLIQIDNLFISDRFNKNDDSDDDYDDNYNIKCVECGKYHADCVYKNCNHTVNHNCAIRKIEFENKCKECQSHICKKNYSLIETNEQETCSICLEKTNTKLKDCGHFFHKKCIEEHSKNSNSCPMCRDDICKLAIEKKMYNDVKYSLGNFKEGTFSLNYINF